MMACRVVAHPGESIAPNYHHYHLYFLFLVAFLKNNLEHHMFCVGRLEGGFDTTALWQRPDPIDRLDGQPGARG